MVLANSALRLAPVAAEPLIARVRDVGFAAMLADPGQPQRPSGMAIFLLTRDAAVDRPRILFWCSSPAAVLARGPIALGVQPFGSFHRMIVAVEAGLAAILPLRRIGVMGQGDAAALASVVEI